MARTNLCPDPSLELAPTTWTLGYLAAGRVASSAVGARVRRQRTTAAAAGAYIGELDVTGNTTDPGGSDVDVFAPTIAVVPGQPYSLSAASQCDSTGVRVLAAVAWFGAGGAAVARSSAPSLDVPTLGWRTRPTVALVAPAGAATARLELVHFLPRDTLTRTIRFDAALYEQALEQGPYFDGDSTLCVWLGSAHASASVDRSEAFAAAAESPDRRPIRTMRADFGRDGTFSHPLKELTPMVDSVTVDRDLSGGLPAEIGLFEGFLAASAKATLSGGWDETTGHELGALQTFAPWRKDSPLYGDPLVKVPVEIETGFVTDEGEVLDRRFTGSVSKVNAKSANRTVALDALDPAARLHAPITLGASAMYDFMLTTYGPEAYRSRMNSQWIVDHILRRNGYCASPRFRPDVLLAATMHGAMIPEVGWGGTVEEVYSTFRKPVWKLGPFGMLAPIRNGPRGRWWIEKPITAAPGTGIGVSMWAELGAGSQQKTWIDVPLTVDGSVALVLGANADGRPYFGIYIGSTFYGQSPGSAWTVPPSSGRQWTFFGAHIAFTDTTAKITFRVDGLTSVGSMTIPRRVGAWQPNPMITYTFHESCESFSLWSSPRAPGTPGGGAWVGEQHTPEADIDVGANELFGIPEQKGVDSLPLLQQVTAAELASFGFSEAGRPWWVSEVGRAARGRPLVREQLTADRSLADLVGTTDEASVRNVITATVTKQLLGAWTDMLTAKDVLDYRCSPGVTRFPLELPEGTVEIPRSGNGVIVTTAAPGTDASIVFATDEPAWKDIGERKLFQNRIRMMITRADVPGAVVTSGVAVRIIRTSPWAAELVIANGNPFPIRFATPDTYSTDTTTGVVTTTAGTAALIIPCRKVEKGEDQGLEVRDENSVRLYDESVYPVPGAGTWRQWIEPVKAILSMILASSAHPVPTVDAVDVPHDPRRRLGQEIEYLDPDGLGSIVVRLLGLSTTVSTSGSRDKLESRPIAPPGLGLLDDPELGLADETLIAA